MDCDGSLDPVDLPALLARSRPARRTLWLDGGGLEAAAPTRGRYGWPTLRSPESCGVARAWRSLPTRTGTRGPPEHPAEP